MLSPIVCRPHRIESERDGHRGEDPARAPAVLPLRDTRYRRTPSTVSLATSIRTRTVSIDPKTII